MSNYQQLSKIERLEIEILLNKKYTLRDIADVLQRNVSTISREIHRNTVKGTYYALKAHHKRYVRRKYCKIQLKKIRENPELEDYIQKELQLYRSPEQIKGRWNVISQSNITISTKTIYQYIYSAHGNKYSKYLYSKRWKPKKRIFRKTPREMIPDRTWIDDRPISIETRNTIGDFEGDTIVSTKTDKTSILVLVDRTSRYSLIQKIPNRKPKYVKTEMDHMVNLNNIQTITLDNGIEFKHHYQLSCKTYFCHPYSSWEKGTVEYTNRLIRRFIPKKTLIKNYSQKYIQLLAHHINHTPRKCLNYKTPYEVFHNQIPIHI